MTTAPSVTLDGRTSSVGSRQSDGTRPWRAMARVTWLEHRGAFLGLFVVYTALALAIILGEGSTQANFATYLAHGCATNPFHSPCGTIENSFSNNTDLFSALVIALNVLPVVVGVFVGAPLLSRELETGTYRFAFTQGIGRRRYLLTTLAILAAYVVAGAPVLGVLLGGWAHSFEVVGTESRWQAGLFATTWPALAGWSLTALALGVLFGAVIKKTVTAMGTTAGVVGGLVLGSFTVFVRQLLSIAPLDTKTVSPLGLNLGGIYHQSFQGVGLPGAWLVRAWMTGQDGQALDSTRSQALLQQLYNTNGKVDPARFLALHHVTYWVAYQPAERFWLFESVAGALLVATATAVTIAAVHRLRRLA